MKRFMERMSKTTFLPPGTLIHVGEKKSEKIKITVLDYDEGQFQKTVIKSVEECFPFKDRPTVTWINIDGLHNTEIIEKIGAEFEIHPLVLEDILNTSQRPKIEYFDDYVFIVLKMICHNKEKDEVEVEQVSVVLGQNFIISFQEKEGDVFNPIRERISNNKGRIRKMKTDYLAYSLLDSIVDMYFYVLEVFSEKIEIMEEDLVINPVPETLQIIHNLKRNIIFLRKSVWPLREVISSMEKSESKIIKKTTHIYLRDVYDHTIQVIDTMETFRDMVSGMLDIYMSSVSNKMNEVMKVLTIIATIFIPLTFITGIYGMNFKYMPELEWAWGYAMVWGVIVFAGILMGIFFKRKKWF